MNRIDEYDLFLCLLISQIFLTIGLAFWQIFTNRTASIDIFLTYCSVPVRVRVRAIDTGRKENVVIEILCWLIERKGTLLDKFFSLSLSLAHSSRSIWAKLGEDYFNNRSLYMSRICCWCSVVNNQMMLDVIWHVSNNFLLEFLMIWKRDKLIIDRSWLVYPFFFFSPDYNRHRKKCVIVWIIDQLSLIFLSWGILKY